MRFRGRRTDGVEASYAAVLDGVHLWLDVDAPVSVRDTASGTETALGAHPHDLAGLTGSTYDVLAGGRPVRLAADPGRPLTRTPLAPDGVTQWSLARTDDGRLQLRRASAPTTAELDAVDVRDGRLHLRVRPPGEVEPGSHLLLLDTDDRVLETLPATAHEGLVETLLGVDDLPAGYFGVLRLAVGTEERWVRIRRGRNDLADPNHAVLLPELFAADRSDAGTATGDVPGPGPATGTPRARLRWNPDGLLALRSLDPDVQG